MDARIFVLANKDVVKFEATAGADSGFSTKRRAFFEQQAALVATIEKPMAKVKCMPS